MEKKPKNNLQIVKFLYKDIVNTIGESLLVLDAKFNVLYANQSFYKNFKVNKKETENKSFFKLGRNQWDIPEMHNFFKKILPQNKIFNDFEINHNFPKLGQKIMKINARQVVDGVNKDKTILVVIKDITEEKKLMAKIMQTNKISALGQLTMGIAHGLNSPLTGIYNFLHVYYKQEKAGSQKSKELKLMLSACVYMSELINSLTILGPENKSSLTKINLNDVVDSVILFTKRQLMVNNIKLIKKIPTNPLFVKGNNAQLQQMLLNIIVNAKEAIKNKGQITIKASKGKNNFITLEVADDGCGISEDALKRVFDPFFTTKIKHGHMGMGLASVLEIIKNHKAKIKIKKQKKGTKIIINLLAAKT